MRRIHLLLPFLLMFALAGCDSDECVLDTDCADFQLICVERQCVPPGTMPDGGAVDGAVVAPDAGSSDGGAPTDAAQDASMPVDGATPICPDITGEWVLDTASAECLRVPAIVTFTAGAEACQFTSSAHEMTVFTVDMSGAITGTEPALDGGMVRRGCTGMASEAAMTISCGTCELSLSR